MDKYIGRRLDGRYLVDELVGIGGMANVYKATDVANGRTVAVKILRDEYVQNGDLLRRFKNESKAVALLSHPNIVKVYDVNFSDRVNYIVMEYIDGVTLKDYMEHRGALDWKETLYFTVQILRALQHAHDNGIVHRDIKPQNIMLLKDGSIKVTDFGIARFARSGMHTMTDKAIGSVHYISPEQARGEATDNRADLYSVGVMMYEMLTGRLPFEAESAVGVAIKHIEEAPVPPSTWNLDIPAGLEAIVLRAMQKDPADRYASAAEMLRDIDSFKKDPSISFEYRYRTPARAGERLEKEVEDVQQEQQRHSRQEGMKGAGGRAGGIAAVFSNKKKAGRRAERNPSHSGGKGQPSRRRVAAENEQLGEEARKSASSRGKGRGGSGLLTMLVGITCAFVIGTGIFVGTMFLLNNPFERVADIKVPNLIGLDYDTVQNDPAYADYNIVISQSAYNADYPEGQIYDQSPDPDRTVKTGGTIEVKVSQGTEMGTVPIVMGREPETALTLLAEAGFTNVTQSEVYSNVVPSGLVCGVNPGEGSEVSTSTSISLQISQGPESAVTEVPDLGGRSLSSARRMLEEAGLLVGEISYRSSESSTDTVIGQDPVFGSSVSEGSYVNLTLSSGDRDIGSVQLNISLPDSGSATMTATVLMDGETVMERQVQPNLTNIWRPTVTGYGVAEVEILLDGEHYRTYEVDFDEGTSTQID